MVVARRCLAAAGATLVFSSSDGVLQRKQAKQACARSRACVCFFVLMRAAVQAVSWWLPSVAHCVDGAPGKASGAEFFGQQGPRCHAYICTVGTRHIDRLCYDS